MKRLGVVLGAIFVIVSGHVGNKHVEETFEVTAEEYKYYKIGNTFIKDVVLENEEGDRE